MRYNELSLPWQRVFALAWESLQKGSKAIAAVIVSDTGEIISEGRNKIEENVFPNPVIAHAETEAVMNLDIERYSNPKNYTLYAGLEPCPMCMGTIVMGRLRHVIIAARDIYGGAMDLLDKNYFLKTKKVTVEYTEPILGSVQRTLQVLRELIFDKDEEKREKTLMVIAMKTPEAVEVAKELVNEDIFKNAFVGEIPFSVLFDDIVERIEAKKQESLQVRERYGY